VSPESALSALATRLFSLAAAEWFLLLVGLGLGVAALVFAARRLQSRRARGVLEEAVRQELHIPGSLHPVIDPDVCIGSGSCIQACPEGRILGLINGVATLINAGSCIGHGRCAAECPVDAIKLVFGTAERGVDLPEVDGAFESSRPGVYIVGELGGMGLIKNALTQGLQVAARVREALGSSRRPRGDDAVDVAIVGAGPAGIATAVGTRAAGLSYVLFEQDTLGGAIAHYPRQKIAMTETVKLPFYGPFGRPFMTKEDLLASLENVVAAAGVEIQEQARVLSVDGRSGDFVITSSRGVVRARRVVLAIGRRGTPRTLGVPGEDLPKVTSRLIDPDQYHGRRVLIVGGGDSALEAAATLAGETTAEVTIAYRGPQFARGRALNKQKVEALRAAGRLRVHLATEVTTVEPGVVHLVSGGVPATLANDFVITCLGGELPSAFLKGVGIGIRRHRGDQAMPNPALAMRSRREGHRAAWMLALAGLAILAFLAVSGGSYYLLPDALRYKSPQHALLKASGTWGHGVGILATAVMLLNFVYPVRKRARLLKRRGPIAPWLRFHVFVGLTTPPAILFHSAFRWGNPLATATYVSLVVVVVTGLLGRFIYGFFRIDAEDTKRVARLREWARPILRALRAVPGLDGAALASLDHLETFVEGRTDAPGSPSGLLLGLPRRRQGLRRALRRLEPWFIDRRRFPAFRAGLLRLARLDLKLEFHGGFKRLMHTWRVFHVALSVVLVGLIGAHIWLSLHIGFKWIWS
jgi:thioredoxin reductase/NAD-dependent dihydropyrimidine dehydrogenase PreA subunit